LTALSFKGLIGGGLLYIENSTFGVIISWSGRVSILLVIGESGWTTENGTGWIGHVSDQLIFSHRVFNKNICY